MKFYKLKLCKNNNDLKRLVSKKKFKLTYINLYSIGVKNNLVYNYDFLIDGWPLVKFFKYMFNIDAQLMSFYNMKDFWLSYISKNKIVIAGYSKDDHKEILKYFEKAKIPSPTMIDGYLNDESLITELKCYKEKVIFLGIGQPRQEIILNKLDDDYRIISCGAFFKQLAEIEKEFTGISRALGLTVFMRWWSNPIMLYRRTLLPLFKLKNSII
mgnify:CR=1 FL=1